MNNKKTEEYLFDYQPVVEPVLISACFLGIPCRWHGRRAKRRDALIEKLKRNMSCTGLSRTARRNAYTKNK